MNYLCRFCIITFLCLLLFGNTALGDISDDQKEDIKNLLNNFLRVPIPKSNPSLNNYNFYVPYSACNIALIEALHAVYNNTEFKTINGTNIYPRANEIYDYLSISNEWIKIGNANSQDTLAKAQCFANKGYQVIAASKGSPHGHVALIMPGKLVASGQLRKWYPNMFSFFLKKPSKTKVGAGMSYGWKPCVIHEVAIFYRSAEYDFFNLYLASMPKPLYDIPLEPFPICETDNLQRCDKIRSNIKIEIKKLRRNMLLPISGYVSTDTGEPIIKITWKNYSLYNGTIISGSVSDYENNDPNVYCWTVNNIPIYKGENKISITAESDLGNKATESIIIKYPDSDFQNSSEQAQRLIASTSTVDICNEVQNGLSVNQAEITNESSFKINGYYKFDYEKYGEIDKSYFEFSNDTSMINLSIEKEKGYIKWSTKGEIPTTISNDTIFITFEHVNGKVSEDYFTFDMGDNSSGQCSPDILGIGITNQ